MPAQVDEHADEEHRRQPRRLAGHAPRDGRQVGNPVVGRQSGRREHRDGRQQHTPPARCEHPGGQQDRVHPQLVGEGPQRSVDRRGIRVVVEHPRQLAIHAQEHHRVPAQVAPRGRVAQVPGDPRARDGRPQHEDRQQQRDPQPGIDPERAGDHEADRLAIRQQAAADQVAARHEEGHHRQAAERDAQRAPQRFGRGIARRQREAVADDHRRGGREANQVEVVVAAGSSGGLGEEHVTSVECRPPAPTWRAAR